LFAEGEPCEGIYLIESGEIRLEVTTREKCLKVFDTVNAEVVLGLSETMSGLRHTLTAEAAGPVQASFVERTALLKFLARHCDACMLIVALLSEDLHGLYRRCRSVTAADIRSRNKASKA